MTSPDLTALRTLMKAVNKQNTRRVHERAWGEILYARPAAMEALERMEETSTALHADETGHLHRCLFLVFAEPPRWSCVEGCPVQRAERAEARLARLEEALRETHDESHDADPSPDCDVCAMLVEGRDG